MVLPRRARQQPAQALGQLGLSCFEICDALVFLRFEQNSSFRSLCLHQLHPPLGREDERGPAGLGDVVSRPLVPQRGRREVGQAPRWWRGRPSLSGGVRAGERVARIDTVGPFAYSPPCLPPIP